MNPVDMWALQRTRRLEAAGAKTISKKPNKQRNEVSHSLRDIRHTKKISLRKAIQWDYRLQYITSVTPYVQTSTLPVDAHGIR
jgi:hypothetical protein